MNAYERRQWQIIEHHFIPERMPHTETICTIGNGLVGVRGSFEEGYPGDTSTTLVAGIFNHKAGELVPELVSIPNCLALKIGVDGQVFRLDQGSILGYERILDMKTAVLRRNVLWMSHTGTVVRLRFERFASLANPYMLALRVIVQVLSEGTHEIQVESVLDTSVINPGNINHWREVHTRVDGQELSFHGVTDQSAYEVAMRSRLEVEGISTKWMDTSDERLPQHTAKFTTQSNQPITITKYVSLHTTRDSDSPLDSCQNTLATMMSEGYESLLAAHEEAWQASWQCMDIQIEGDELAQRALRFCTYHMMIAVPTQDERVSIGAKTLSGFGYKGHVFWDTELFLVPPLTMSHPELARKLLMYRYHNLPGARKKAQDEGYTGAMFPWESTDTGEETTPKWVPIDGKQTRIWTGENEQHISSDIAYAVLQYWRWTGDDAWFARYGAEIIIDTARFWGSRVEYNEAADRYELRMQIGPDEYHENIDNSVFTNRLVAWHLEQAGEIWQWLTQHFPDDAQRLGSQLDIDDAVIGQWNEISSKMWILESAEGGGVLEQFEGFFERLQPISLEDYSPRSTNMDIILGSAQTQTTRVIKQADVVMLMALLGEELGDEAFLRRNYDVYSQLVDHGSSLSPSIHSWVAARLGLIDEAYDHFIYAATLDLEDHRGNVRDGIHAACCGGVWQAVVFGFCGVELTEKGIITHPHLPSHWRRVTFQVMYRGEPVNFSISNNDYQV